MWTVGNGRVDGNNCNTGVKSPEPPVEESGDPVKRLARHRAVPAAVRETQERLKGGADQSFMRTGRSGGEGDVWGSDCSTTGDDGTSGGN